MVSVTERIDLRRVLKDFYTASSKAPTVVEVPPLQYLMIDGSGNPNNSPDYAAAVEALYSLSYTVKFQVKKSALGIDAAVMPLEGLWWADDMATFVAGDKDQWRWTMMILQPAHVTLDIVTASADAVKQRRALPGIEHVRLADLHEGLSAQILHLGPYAAEGPTIASLHEYIYANGYGPAGKHHEIYLSDPRRTAPDKLRTVIRQPVQLRQL